MSSNSIYEELPNISFDRAPNWSYDDFDFRHFLYLLNTKNFDYSVFCEDLSFTLNDEHGKEQLRYSGNVKEFCKKFRIDFDDLIYNWSVDQPISKGAYVGYTIEFSPTSLIQIQKNFNVMNSFNSNDIQCLPKEKKVVKEEKKVIPKVVPESPQFQGEIDLFRVVQNGKFKGYFWCQKIKEKDGYFEAVLKKGSRKMIENVRFLKNSAGKTDPKTLEILEA